MTPPGGRDEERPRERSSLAARGGAVFDRALALLLALAVALTALAILVQVFCRYILNAPLSWPEEFAVLMFGWMIFLGAALVQAQDRHIAIDTLRRRAHGRTARFLDLMRHLAIGLVAVVLIWQGVGLARRTVGLEYPAMGISRAFLYAAVPVCFTLLLINLIRSALSPAPREDDHGERHM